MRISYLCSAVICLSLSMILSGCKEDKKLTPQNMPDIVSQDKDFEKKTLKVADGQENSDVNVYSARLPELVKPIFDAFTQETGIHVNFIFLKQGVLERLKSEAEFTPADVILVSDIGAIRDIVDADLSAPIKSKIIDDNIPLNYRNEHNSWVGLTGRVRMLAQTTKKLSIKIDDYDDLAAPELKGRICSRSFHHPYNISMIAGYILENGKEKTSEWLQNFQDNLFDQANGDDTGQIELIASGLCDVAPINHYYYARMVSLDKDLAKKVKLIPLTQMKHGGYMNISGALMSKYSQNKSNAIALIEFLTSKKAQKMFAELDYEIPINPHTNTQKVKFKQGLDHIRAFSLDDIANQRGEALKLIYSLEK